MSESVTGDVAGDRHCGSYKGLDPPCTRLSGQIDLCEQDFQTTIAYLPPICKSRRIFTLGALLTSWKPGPTLVAHA